MTDEETRKNEPETEPSTEPAPAQERKLTLDDVDSDQADDVKGGGWEHSCGGGGG